MTSATGLISFDIDGTMVFGDPPGHISVELVRKAKELGFMVGSASDRTISNQTRLWERAGIEVDFVSLKHRLAEVKERFALSRYVHIGDTDLDRMFAVQAGFEFRWIHEVPADGFHEWLLALMAE